MVQAGIVVAAALALASPTIGFGFVYDDEVQIRDLPRLASGGSSVLAQGGGPEGRYWRPVFHLLETALFRLRGADPGAFHAVAAARAGSTVMPQTGSV